MKKSLPVILLWHMHQPYYKDPLRGEYLLPWTYLHGVKDYFDMAAIVDEVAGARAVFNFVPSLLEQLEEYAAGTAVDPFLKHGTMDPSCMGDEERLFILDNFFAANRQRMIEPNPRYFELFCLAGDGGHQGSDRLRRFRDQDILDLQVWFFLAWTGEAARRRFPEIAALLTKGRGFTPEDKERLFSCHNKILNSIIPLYRKLHAEGKIELSVTPYFHPILPLICDLQSARIAMPRVTLPSEPFRHPEDARSQILAGIAFFKKVFGFLPLGIWPSEGSVSDEVLTLIAECGLSWAATDEGVLAASLGGLGEKREALYHPYRFQNGEKGVSLFFRDHGLSDLIGFTYSQMAPERAIADFIAKLKEISSGVPSAEVVSVILDGENAWEYYQDNGYHFLKGLYQSLAAADGIVPSTCAEVHARGGYRPLKHVHPGSWINSNYGIWIGHPEENRGWDLLARAREAAVKGNAKVAAILASGAPPDFIQGEDTVAPAICRSLFAAEGSDWFWWYGDDHFTAHSDRFDLLFRRHLMSVYRLLGEEVPAELYDPIKKTTPAGFCREPVAFISPRISGVVDDYFEWLAAGLYDLSRQSSAMHAAENLLQSFFFGFDHNFLYFRIDGLQPLETQIRSDDHFMLYLMHDKEYRVVTMLTSGSGQLQVRSGGEWQAVGESCVWAIQKVCEIQVPLAPFGLAPGDSLFAYMTLVRGNDELGRWPVDAPMRLKYSGRDLELDNWLI